MEILKKDLQLVTGNSMTIGISSVPMEMEELLARPDLKVDLQELCRSGEADVVVIMTLSHDSEGQPVRDIAVYSPNRIFRDQISDALDNSANIDLSLDPSYSSFADITVHHQGNVTASLTQVVPILKLFLCGDITPDVTSKEFVIQQSLAMATEGFSHFSGIVSSAEDGNLDVGFLQNSNVNFDLNSPDSFSVCQDDNDYPDDGATERIKISSIDLLNISDQTNISTEEEFLSHGQTNTTSNIFTNCCTIANTNFLENTMSDEQYENTTHDDKYNDMTEFDYFNQNNNSSEELNNNVVQLSKLEEFPSAQNFSTELSNVDDSKIIQFATMDTGTENQSVRPQQNDELLEGNEGVVDNEVTVTYINDTKAQDKYFDRTELTAQNNLSGVLNLHVSDHQCDQDSICDLDISKSANAINTEEKTLFQENTKGKEPNATDFVDSDSSAVSQYLSLGNTHGILDHISNTKNILDYSSSTNSVLDYSSNTTCNRNDEESMQLSNSLATTKSINLNAEVDAMWKDDNLAELTESNLYDTITTPEIQKFHDNSLVNTSGRNSPFVNSRMDSPIDGMFIESNSRTVSESDYHFSVPPNSLQENTFDEFDRNSILLTFESAEIVERVHKKKSSLGGGIDFHRQKDDGALNVSYSAQNCFRDGSNHLSKDISLLNIEDEDISSKVQEKRNSLVSDNMAFEMDETASLRNTEIAKNVETNNPFLFDRCEVDIGTDGETSKQFANVFNDLADCQSNGLHAIGQMDIITDFEIPNLDLNKTSFKSINDTENKIGSTKFSNPFDDFGNMSSISFDMTHNIDNNTDLAKPFNDFDSTFILSSNNFTESIQDNIDSTNPFKEQMSPLKVDTTSDMEKNVNENSSCSCFDVSSVTVDSTAFTNPFKYTNRDNTVDTIVDNSLDDAVNRAVDDVKKCSDFTLNFQDVKNVCFDKSNAVYQVQSSTISAEQFDGIHINGEESDLNISSDNALAKLNEENRLHKIAENESHFSKSENLSLSNSPKTSDRDESAGMVKENNGFANPFEIQEIFSSRNIDLADSFATVKGNTNPFQNLDKVSTVTSENVEEKIDLLVLFHDLDNMSTVTDETVSSEKNATFRNPFQDVVNMTLKKSDVKENVKSNVILTKPFGNIQMMFEDHIDTANKMEQSTIRGHSDNTLVQFDNKSLTKFEKNPFQAINSLTNSDDYNQGTEYQKCKEKYIFDQFKEEIHNPNGILDYSDSFLQTEDHNDFQGLVNFSDANHNLEMKHEDHSIEQECLHVLHDGDKENAIQEKNSYDIETNISENVQENVYNFDYRQKSCENQLVDEEMIASMENTSPIRVTVLKESAASADVDEDICLKLDVAVIMSKAITKDIIENAIEIFPDLTHPLLAETFTNEILNKEIIPTLEDPGELENVNMTDDELSGNAQMALPDFRQEADNNKMLRHEFAIETDYLPRMDPLRGCLNIITSSSSNTQIIETDADKEVVEGESFRKYTVEEDSITPSDSQSRLQLYNTGSNSQKMREMVIIENMKTSATTIDVEDNVTDKADVDKEKDNDKHVGNEQDLQQQAGTHSIGAENICLDVEEEISNGMATAANVNETEMRTDNEKNTINIQREIHGYTIELLADNNAITYREVNIQNIHQNNASEILISDQSENNDVEFVNPIHVTDAMVGTCKNSYDVEKNIMETLDQNIQKEDIKCVSIDNMKKTSSCMSEQNLQENDLPICKDNIFGSDLQTPLYTLKNNVEKDLNVLVKDGHVQKDAEKVNTCVISEEMHIGVLNINMENNYESMLDVPGDVVQSGLLAPGHIVTSKESVLGMLDLNEENDTQNVADLILSGGAHSSFGRLLPTNNDKVLRNISNPSVERLSDSLGNYNGDVTTDITKLIIYDSNNTETNLSVRVEKLEQTCAQNNFEMVIDIVSPSDNIILDDSLFNPSDIIFENSVKHQDFTVPNIIATPCNNANTEDVPISNINSTAMVEEHEEKPAPSRVEIHSDTVSPEKDLSLSDCTIHINTQNMVPAELQEHVPGNLEHLTETVCHEENDASMSEVHIIENNSSNVIEEFENKFGEISSFYMTANSIMQAGPLLNISNVIKDKDSESKVQVALSNQDEHNLYDILQSDNISKAELNSSDMPFHTDFWGENKLYTNLQKDQNNMAMVEHKEVHLPNNFDDLEDFLFLEQEVPKISEVHSLDKVSFSDVVIEKDSEFMSQVDAIKLDEKYSSGNCNDKVTSENTPPVILDSSITETNASVIVEKLEGTVAENKFNTFFNTDVQAQAVQDNSQNSNDKNVPENKELSASYNIMESNSPNLIEVLKPKAEQSNFEIDFWKKEFLYGNVQEDQKNVVIVQPKEEHLPSSFVFLQDLVSLEEIVPTMSDVNILGKHSSIVTKATDVDTITSNLSTDTNEDILLEHETDVYLQSHINIGELEQLADADSVLGNKQYNVDNIISPDTLSSCSESKSDLITVKAHTGVSGAASPLEDFMETMEQKHNLEEKIYSLEQNRDGIFGEDAHVLRQSMPNMTDAECNCPTIIPSVVVDSSLMESSVTTDSISPGETFMDEQACGFYEVNSANVVDSSGTDLSSTNYKASCESIVTIDSISPIKGPLDERASGFYEGNVELFVDSSLADLDSCSYTTNSDSIITINSISPIETPLDAHTSGFFEVNPEFLVDSSETDISKSTYETNIESIETVDNITPVETPKDEHASGFYEVNPEFLVDSSETDISKSTYETNIESIETVDNITPVETPKDEHASGFYEVNPEFLVDSSETDISYSTDKTNVESIKSIDSVTPFETPMTEHASGICEEKSEMLLDSSVEELNTCIDRNNLEINAIGFHDFNAICYMQTECKASDDSLSSVEIPENENNGIKCDEATMNNENVLHENMEMVCDKNFGTLQANINFAVEKQEHADNSSRISDANINSAEINKEIFYRQNSNTSLVISVSPSEICENINNMNALNIYNVNMNEEVKKVNVSLKATKITPEITVEIVENDTVDDTHDFDTVRCQKIPNACDKIDNVDIQGTVLQNIGIGSAFSLIDSPSEEVFDLECEINPAIHIIREDKLDSGDESHSSRHITVRFAMTETKNTIHKQFDTIADNLVIGAMTDAIGSLKESVYHKSDDQLKVIADSLINTAIVEAIEMSKEFKSYVNEEEVSSNILDVINEIHCDDSSDSEASSTTTEGSYKIEQSVEDGSLTVSPKQYSITDGMNGLTSLDLDLISGNTNNLAFSEYDLSTNKHYFVDFTEMNMKDSVSDNGKPVYSDGLPDFVSDTSVCTDEHEGFVINSDKISSVESRLCMDGLSVNEFENGSTIISKIFAITETCFTDSSTIESQYSETSDALCKNTITNSGEKTNTKLTITGEPNLEYDVKLPLNTEVNNTEMNAMILCKSSNNLMVGKLSDISLAADDPHEMCTYQTKDLQLNSSVDTDVIFDADINDTVTTALEKIVDNIAKSNANMVDKKVLNNNMDTPCATVKHLSDTYVTRREIFDTTSGLMSICIESIIDTVSTDAEQVSVAQTQVIVHKELEPVDDDEDFQPKEIVSNTEPPVIVRPNISYETMKEMDDTQEWHEDPIPGMGVAQDCASSDSASNADSDSEYLKPAPPNSLLNDANPKKRIYPQKNLLDSADEQTDGTDDIPTPDDMEGELEWEDDTPITPLSENKRFTDYQDDEGERYENLKFRKVTIAGKDHTVDMHVIEPYKKVLSHGGYYGDGLNAIILFCGCYLPDKGRSDYQYVMENLFLYVISTLELLVAEDYMIVYFHGATPRRQMPSFGWLKRCYQMIDRRLKKNLKALLMVHPTLWLKTVVMMTKPFISSKFTSKLRFVKTLRELGKIIPMEYIYVPDLVQQYDAKITVHRSSTSSPDTLPSHS